MNPTVTPTLLVPIALFGWPVVAVLLFTSLLPRRALIAAFLLGWLFLPVYAYKVAGVPEYSKATAVSLGALLGAAIFDSGRLLSFRPRLLDLPMLLWCLCPMASSLSNGLGPHDGVSEILARGMAWGIPYFLGRVYFADLEALRELAIGIVVGGLIYVPFCLWEMRMSPQLHRQFYGFMQHSFEQTLRAGGGWRPMVFLQHGLAVGMWMTAASLIGVWLWHSGTLKQIRGLPAAYLLGPLLLITLLCKSTGSLALLAAGIGAMFSAQWLRTSILALCLAALVPTYVYCRISGYWSAKSLVAVVGSVAGKQRTASFATRLDNEDRLAERAMQRPEYGWGGWGRSRLINEEGHDVSVTDGMWMIALGENGLVGLISFMAMLLLPLLVLVWRFPARFWGTPAVAPLAVLTLLLVLHMIDNLMNAMVNPLFVLAAGGVTSALGARRRGRPVPVPRRTSPAGIRPVAPVTRHLRRDVP